MKIGMELRVMFFVCALLHNIKVIYADPSKNVQYLNHSKQPADTGPVVVLSMDGCIRTIDPLSGRDRWRIKGDPILKSGSSVQRGFTFLPDPLSGELIFLRDGQLMRLPYSIPQLVTSSPARTMDDIIISGNKNDAWFQLDPATGFKTENLNRTIGDEQCPASKNGGFFLGRSEYQLTLTDLKNHNRQWNVTFINYSSDLQSVDSNYPLIYVVDVDGAFVSLDRSTGSVLWRRTLNFSIVALYSLQNDGLHRIPFVVVGKQTMDRIWQNEIIEDLHVKLEDILWATKSNLNDDASSLYSALYVTESEYGLYALSVYVDRETITFGSKILGPLLLPGPAPIEYKENEGKENDTSFPRDVQKTITQINTDTSSITHETHDGEFLLLGYHEPPKTMQWNIMCRQFPFQQTIIPQEIGFVQSSTHFYTKKDVEEPTNIQINNSSFITIFSSSWKSFLILIFVFALSFIVIVKSSTLMLKTAKGIEILGSSNVEKRFHKSVSRPENDYELVGKITYNPQLILGRGCDGTIVYRGKFDGRQVAVKRVVAEMIHTVNREVDLLRESDEHMNVIRYFCMESDSHFRYIALELCSSSLSDYIQDEDIRLLYTLTPVEILRQTTNGLAHLHSLNIVHRDLKPQNILFSAKNHKGQVRVLISDFGMCKRLLYDSSMNRSGLIGTDGWIAPELFNPQNKVTYSVDIFPLGCIFYYVLTRGFHPFGDSIQRQSNILSAEYDFSRLMKEENVPAIALIHAMIQKNSEFRPCANDSLSHPLFWSSSKQLQFFLDISDRIEKLLINEPIVRRLERRSRLVIGKSWRNRICSALAEDLRKFRSYKDHALRDLLRAMRNKKHHYSELPENVRLSLGKTPDEFLHYFTSRFPLLLMHTYEAMECCRDEDVFSEYYPRTIFSHTYRALLEESEISHNTPRRLIEEEE